MMEWKEAKEEIREITPDKETARSILKMIATRAEALKLLDLKQFSSLIVEDHYEIIKEAITALMAIEGHKTLSHEALVCYLKEFYKEFSAYQIELIDRMRKLRNKIVYKGFFVNPDFLSRNESEIQNITKKVTQILKKKLESY